MSAVTGDTVVLNISDMIDLAIGTPEVGTVDFNMLQTVLHCLAQQQQVLEKTVEVRGVSLPLQRDSSNAQTVNVQEFAVGTDGSPPVQKQRKKSQPDDTILVVERIKKIDSPTQMKPAPQTAKVAAQTTASVAPSAVSAAAGGAGATGGAGVAGAAGAGGGTGAAGAAGAPGAGLEGLSLVTYSKFNLLENSVQELQKRVYGSMPKNQEILEEVRSQTNIKAIQDMWQNLNVSARLEAAETGIEKLSSLVQDIINETSALQGKVQDVAAAAGVPQQITDSKGAPSTTAAPAPSLAAKSILAAKSVIEDSPSTTEGGVGATASKADLANLQDLVNRLQGDLENLAEAFTTSMKKMGAEVPALPAVSKARIEEIMPPKPAPTAAGGGPTGGEGSEGKSRAKRPARTDGGGGGAPGDADANLIELMERLNDFEKRLQECQKDLAKCCGGTQDQLNSFQDQLEYLSKQMGTLSVASGSMSPELVKDLQGLMQLFQTVQDMQTQLAQVHDTALQLAAEKEDRKNHINVLLEQIDMLKTIKLDREDMAEAMAEKADLRMLARKVSHDQFELACDDLSRGLEHALGKLNMQEALWQQALDDIQREIETKLDKMELSPVKEFFNSKLKMLQESLKQMASLRREAEAAGTKRKLLRDVNCLSCDANAVMPMEAPPSIPVPKPFPGTLSMKPYLSYELDTIRKTQASNLPQRNMHDWENIDKMAQQPKQHRVRTSVDRHMCNRYCGGSHTTTTPAQRVARLGHFIKQWGPDVLPLSSGLAAGDDGRMYRVSPDGTKVPAGGAGETYSKPQKKPENSVITERYVGDDCKCMDLQPASTASAGVQFQSAKGK